MAHKTRIKQFARGATQSRRARLRVERRLAAVVDDHFKDPARLDGRGRKTKELCAVETALRHMIHAIGWQTQQDLDLNVRQKAQALVKTVCHGQVSFKDLMDQASTLRGRVNRAGKVRNARKPVKGCKPVRAELPQGFAVERLHTVERLAKVGRAFGNCAKNNGHGLHDALRKRESDFYLVLRRDEPLAMFQVDLETAKVTEFKGQRNDDVELPRAVLIAMLRGLKLNGDDVEACLQQGAAAIFATGFGDVHKPHWQRGKLKAWRGPGRLLIKEDAKPPKANGRRRPDRWSSFEWDGDWESSYASKRHRLDDLMTHHPSLAKLARKAVKAGRGR